MSDKLYDLLEALPRKRQIVPVTFILTAITERYNYIGTFTGRRDLSWGTAEPGGGRSGHAPPITLQKVLYFSCQLPLVQRISMVLTPSDSHSKPGTPTPTHPTPDFTNSSGANVIDIPVYKYNQTCLPLHGDLISTGWVTLGRRTPRQPSTRRMMRRRNRNMLPGMTR